MSFLKQYCFFYKGIPVLAVVMLGGCFPYPHTEKTAPKITGSLTDDQNQPLQGVALALSKDRECKKLTDTTVSGLDGSFVIGPTDQFKLFIQTEIYTDWTLCAERNNSYFRIGGHGRLGPPPQSITLDCQLTTDSDSLMGICS